ncbi:hypothetical protein HU200_017042 [Digitaria exilis]|uniref:60S ribosomal export protein NMD3 OB-fold domain-containing protein n=1 Tax=Digitaria exilis TaxID=1010633 RepID=A0A835F7C6_9POAL|nr:hypothetical protein HU200_017042 [Digitaria exilis]
MHARSSTSSSRSGTAPRPRRGNAGGLDLYFASRSHAASLVDLSLRHTFSVELCPICRDDLISCLGRRPVPLVAWGPSSCASRSQARSRFSAVDTKNMRVVVLLLGIKEPVQVRAPAQQPPARRVRRARCGAQSVRRRQGGSPYIMSCTHVARSSDFSKSDTVFAVKTHLGYKLKPVDYALGTTSTQR